MPSTPENAMPLRPPVAEVRRKGPARAASLDGAVPANVTDYHDFRLEIKESAALDLCAARNNGIDRVLVAERMSAILGKPISRSMVDAWVSVTKTTHHLPLAYLAAWVRATGSTHTLTCVCRASGRECEAARVVELGRRYLDVLRAERDLSEAVAEAMGETA